MFGFHALAQALVLQGSGTISGVSPYSSEPGVRALGRGRTRAGLLGGVPPVGLVRCSSGRGPPLSAWGRRGCSTISLGLGSPTLVRFREEAFEVPRPRDSLLRLRGLARARRQLHLRVGQASLRPPAPPLSLSSASTSSSRRAESQVEGQEAKPKPTSFLVTARNSSTPFVEEIEDLKILKVPRRSDLSQKGRATAATEVQTRRRYTCAATGSGPMLNPSKNLLRTAQLWRVLGVVILGQGCQVRQLADHAWEGPFAKCRRAP